VTELQAVESRPGAELGDEFHRQVQNLVAKGYPGLADMAPDVFERHAAPLKERLRDLPVSGDARRIPFVIVISSEMVASENAMPLVELGGKQGFVRMYPSDPKCFSPIEAIDLPRGLAYLVADVDTGPGTLDVTPDDALEMIASEGRSPLTIDEGIALVSQHPEVLKTKNCFSILGSRSGDKRVPALWISGGSPRLGWCWAGNPHTWLGSASCAARVGPA